MTAPITSNTLSVNVFTAPGKAMITIIADLVVCERHYRRPTL